MGIRSLVVLLSGELIGNKSQGKILEWLNVPPFEYTQKNLPKAHTPLSVVYSQTNCESYCLENILNLDGVVSCTVSDYRKLVKLFPNHEWISRLVSYILTKDSTHEIAKRDNHSWIWGTSLLQGNSGMCVKTLKGSVPSGQAIPLQKLLTGKHLRTFTEISSDRCMLKCHLL